jgi:hypothetical protein
MTEGALLTGAAGLALRHLLGGGARGPAISVVVARNPVHSALYLLLSFCSSPCIFILQQAEFVGAVQILVYAGGIMVLFLFVVMLVNPRTVREVKAFQHQWDVALLLLPVFLIPVRVHPVDGEASRGRGQPGCVPHGPRPHRREHGGGGVVALPRLPAAVRGRVRVPAGRDDRSRGAGKRSLEKMD